jgi:orotate phosphoribosyltransferase
MLNEMVRQGFVRRIKEINVFQDASKSPEGRGFRLKKHEREPDAPLSPFYLNYRLLQSDYDAKMMAVSLFEHLLEELDMLPDLLAAIPEAIVPVVSTLSDRMRIPMVTPRAAKAHGSGSKVDGLWKPGMTAALFDDVVADADSKLDAQAALVGVGISVTDVFVLTDRQQWGARTLAAVGLKLHAAFTLDELLEGFRELRILDMATLKAIAEYRALEVS